jgi:hypothetical protein
VPFGKQFMKNLFVSKNKYKIAGVIGYFTFKNQDIFSYLNSIEGQFFFPKKLFFSIFHGKKTFKLKNFFHGDNDYFTNKCITPKNV